MSISQKKLKTKELSDNVALLISEEKFKKAYDLLSALHPVDIVEISEGLTLEQFLQVYSFFSSKLATDVLLELSSSDRRKIFSKLTSEEIVEKFLKNMISDDAADIVIELEEDKREETIRLLRLKNSKHPVIELVNYDEDIAGGLMAKEFIKIEANQTVLKAAKEIKRQSKKNMDKVFSIYVVNDTNKLLGRVSIKRLFFASEDQCIKDLYETPIYSVNVRQSKEEVSNIMRKYDLIVLPVVDDFNRLQGIISIDDVVDVIKEEAEKDFQLASGITEQVNSKDSLFHIIRSRIPWLMLGLLGGILSSRVVSGYEKELTLFPQMTFFIPLIAAMAGNVGVQSSAVVVQSLANNTYFNLKFSKRFVKDFLVGLFNALICSLVLFIYNYIFDLSPKISLTVSISLFSVIIFAALTGTLIPLVLHRLKIDPALATGPFITTTNDIVGLLIYFLIGFFINI